jgi:hypothetical protein
MARAISAASSSGFSPFSAPRTSNHVDRLMNRLYRLLYAGRGLHGHHGASERRLRGWALLHNLQVSASLAGFRLGTSIIGE